MTDKKTKPEAQPATVKVAVPRGTGPIAISLAGNEPIHYREIDGFVEVPVAELDLFLQYVGESVVIEPAAPAEKEK